MLSGKDRGKTGKILFSFPQSGKVVIESLNLVKKHQRAKREGQKGQIISKERAVSVSSVQLVCPRCGKATRAGHKIEGDLKTRVCKKCGSEI